MPFKTGANKNDPDIKTVYEQKNYLNQILHTISKQVDNIDTKIENNNEQTINKFMQNQHPFLQNLSQFLNQLLNKLKSQKTKFIINIKRLENLDKGKCINIIDEEEELIEFDNNTQEINRIKNKI